MKNPVIMWLGGYIRVQMTGKYPERFFNLCSNRNIFLWDVKKEDEQSEIKAKAHVQKPKAAALPDESRYEFSLRAADFFCLKSFVKKSRVKLKISKKAGLPFFLHRNRKRKLLFAGAAVCLCLLYSLSFFIWDIHFEGNTRYTDDVLMNFLNQNGYVHGILKRNIRCEEIETLLRMEYNEITWASARIDGSRLIIAIKENDMKDVAEAETAPRDLVAEKDGVIQEIITRQGTPLVKPGDTVVKGQILVSGVVEIRDDSDTVAAAHHVRADADITAQTVYNYKDTFSLVHENKIYTGRKIRQYYIRAGGWQLDTFWRKAKYAQYDEVTSQTQLSLGGNFRLPVRYGVTEIKEYEIYEAVYTQEEAKAVAETNLAEFFENLMKKGVQIVEKNVKIDFNGNLCTVSGTINLVEPMGTGKDIDIPEEIPAKEQTD